MIVLFWILISLFILMFLFRLTRIILAKFVFKEDSQFEGVPGSNINIFEYLFLKTRIMYVSLILAFSIYFLFSFIPSFVLHYNQNFNLPLAEKKLELYQSYDGNVVKSVLLEEKLKIIKIKITIEGIKKSQLFFWVE